MTGLAEFLAARLDDDERIARAAIDKRANGEPEHWRWECTHDDTPLDVDLAIASNAEFLEHPDCLAPAGLRSTVDYPSSAGPYGHLVIEGEEVRPQDARHIARHDPARVLREVAAKRKILADIIPLIDGMEERIEDEWGSGLTSPARPDKSNALLKLLALPYSDHPDYDQGWAP